MFLSQFSQLSSPQVPLLTHIPDDCYIHLAKPTKSKAARSEVKGSLLVSDQPGQLDPNQLINPPWVVKIMENDWKEYFSLEDLTNAKCRACAHHRCPPKKNLVMGKNGAFKLESVLSDTSREHLMDTSSWREAIYCMCNIIDCHLPGPYVADVANHWRVHADYLQNWNDFKENFSLYLLYDIRV